MNYKNLSAAGFAVAAVFSSPLANAAMLDLTGGGMTTGMIEGVTFTWDQMQPSGTGVLDPFLRVQNNGSEQGYNTSVANAGQLPFDEKFGIWTHDLLLSDLEVNAGNYNFVLDIAEPGNSESLLSLDGLRLYATNTPGQNNATTDLNGDWTGPADATLLWDMDATEDSYVLLDANRNGNPGNGVSDMRMEVPQAIIDAGATAGYSNFILWSRFGLNAAAQPGAGSFGSFEEWAHVTGLTDPVGPSGVPLPAPWIMWALGATLLGVMRRRLRNR